MHYCTIANRMLFLWPGNPFFIKKSSNAPNLNLCKAQVDVYLLIMNALFLSSHYAQSAYLYLSSINLLVGKGLSRKNETANHERYPLALQFVHRPHWRKQYVTLRLAIVFNHSFCNSLSVYSFFYNWKTQETARTQFLKFIVIWCSLLAFLQWWF